jgi:hypothetical protein
LVGSKAGKLDRQVQRGHNDDVFEGNECEDSESLR